MRAHDEDPERPERMLYHPSLRSKRQTGTAWTAGGHIFRSGQSGFPQTNEENQCPSTASPRNTLPTLTPVVRKIGTPFANRRVPNAESRFSQQLISELALGDFPLHEVFLPRANQAISLSKNLAMPIGRQDFLARQIGPKIFHQTQLVLSAHLLQVDCCWHALPVADRAPVRKRVIFGLQLSSPRL